MVFTKTQLGIMEIFVSQITEKYSINQIAKMLKKPYALTYNSIKDLINKGFLIKDKNELLSLNYKENHSELAYVESIRKSSLFKRNTTIKFFNDDFNKKLELDFFTILIFGSTVISNKGKDIDVLVIIENPEKVESIQRYLNQITGLSTNKFDAHVIAVESVYEMFSQWEQRNVMNETLNKHIILYGAENYYRMLKNARR